MDATATDGSLLLNEIDTLDRIAKKQKLTPLTSFMDNREPPDDYYGDPSGLHEVLGEWEQWFSIDDAVHTMQTIIALIDEDPKVRRKFEHPDCVRADLDEIASWLRKARELGVKFRFGIG